MNNNTKQIRERESSVSKMAERRERARDAAVWWQGRTAAQGWFELGLDGWAEIEPGMGRHERRRRLVDGARNEDAVSDVVRLGSRPDLWRSNPAWESGGLSWRCCRQRWDWEETEQQRRSLVERLETVLQWWDWGRCRQWVIQVWEFWLIEWVEGDRLWICDCRFGLIG